MTTHIILKGRTKRGKQVVREQGAVWRIWRFDENLPCFDGNPGLLIAPFGLAWHDNQSRWIEATISGREASVDFIIEEMDDLDSRLVCEFCGQVCDDACDEAQAGGFA